MNRLEDFELSALVGAPLMDGRAPIKIEMLRRVGGKSHGLSTPPKLERHQPRSGCGA
jgi:hypothetical protein